MKQHIDKSQWDELSDEEKKRFYKDVESIIPLEIKIEKPPNIGQMIQFLGDDWFVGTPAGQAPNYDDPQPVENEKLCDSLWEACKEKLKTV